MYKKTILATTMVLLLMGVTLLPVSAQLTSSEELENQETTAIDAFMRDVECIALESSTFSDFVQKLRDHIFNKEYSKFAVINEFFSKILQYLQRTQRFSIEGIKILDLLGKSSSRLGSNFFVISYGAYHRLNPRKENSIDLFKEGFSLWRYSDTSRLLRGKTLIFERHPFGIHQKMMGPQLGIMRGFRGIFLDIESRLTGNSYVIFIGGARRIRAFDLTPLSK